MQNMKYLATFAGVALFTGLAVMVLAANPVVTLIGKLVIAASIMGFAATATAYVMDLSVAGLAIRNEDFHWH